MALKLRERVFEYLQLNQNVRSTARSIAEWILETYPMEAMDKQNASRRLTTTAELLNQIVAEIGASRPNWQKSYSSFRTTEGVRPRLYYWSTKTESEEVADAEQFGESSPSIPPMNSGPEIIQDRILEHDLYPMLLDYLKLEHDVSAYRIDERTASNRAGPGGNKWLYPDVVGIESLLKGHHNEVRLSIQNSGARRARLWSFEVKLLLNRSNVREAYFQAVSNSSWANLGYLVANEIEGAETIKEIRILYAMHGIGLIKLDSSNPDDSEILIPARERPELEWAMCSRLAFENSDFGKFMERLRQYFQTGDI